MHQIGPSRLQTPGRRLPERPARELRLRIPANRCGYEVRVVADWGWSPRGGPAPEPTLEEFQIL